jgi:hypothetical protein
MTGECGGLIPASVDLLKFELFITRKLPLFKLMLLAGIPTELLLASFSSGVGVEDLSSSFARHSSGSSLLVLLVFAASGSSALLLLSSPKLGRGSETGDNVRLVRTFETDDICYLNKRIKMPN